VLRRRIYLLLAYADAVTQNKSGENVFFSKIFGEETAPISIWGELLEIRIIQEAFGLRDGRVLLWARLPIETRKR